MTTDETKFGNAEFLVARENFGMYSIKSRSGEKRARRLARCPRSSVGVHESRSFGEWSTRALAATKRRGQQLESESILCIFGRALQNSPCLQF